MTREEAERILEAWRVRLVPEWTVAIDWATPTGDRQRAEVDHSRHHLSASVRLASNWTEHLDIRPGEDVDEEREVDLVHELVHLLHRDVDEAARAAGERLGGEAGAVAREAYGHAVEGLVERTARALVTLAPVRG